MCRIVASWWIPHLDLSLSLSTHSAGSRCCRSINLHHCTIVADKFGVHFLVECACLVHLCVKRITDIKINHMVIARCHSDIFTAQWSTPSIGDGWLGRVKLGVRFNHNFVKFSFIWAIFWLCNIDFSIIYNSIIFNWTHHRYTINFSIIYFRPFIVGA